MKLSDYLTHHGLSLAQFGEQIGRSAQRVHEWKIGRKIPRAEALAAIERATKGKVTAVDFVEDKE